MRRKSVVRPRTWRATSSAGWAQPPRLECDWESLKSTYRRSLVDLAALRFSPPIAGGRSLPAAGLPWFMTMFGRDSIFTSLQALPFTPELAATTLQALGEWQGTRVDDFRDEDPGRILHEMRYGEMTAFEERPHSPYYGCADATLLYVVLLDEYERWTGDRRLVRDLELEARAALAWIDDYADLQGQRLRLLQAEKREDRSREPVLERLLGFDLVQQRTPAGLPARDVRAPGLRLRREDARRRLRALVWKDQELADGSSARPPT
jgi:glycogen debranching enzyme